MVASIVELGDVRIPREYTGSERTGRGYTNRRRDFGVETDRTAHEKGDGRSERLLSVGLE